MTISKNDGASVGQSITQISELGAGFGLLLEANDGALMRQATEKVIAATAFSFICLILRSGRLRIEATSS